MRTILGYNVIGTGLLALDVILNGSKKTPPKINAGGSCGNVLTILSYLGYNSYPISRLGDNQFTELLLADLENWKVNSDFVQKLEEGSTPIIIQRIKKNSSGEPIHKFEFKNPITGNWLPSFKPVLAKRVPEIIDQLEIIPNVFYFDRLTRSSVELAKYAKKLGALVLFEPSSIKESKLLEECLSTIDIIKFSKDRIKNYSSQYQKAQVPLEVETLGSNGINFRFKGKEWIHLPPFKFDGIVDTAGAGDWCTAGIVRKIIECGGINKLSIVDIAHCINYGQALGGLNCYFDGARGLMYEVSPEELEKTAQSIVKQSQAPPRHGLVRNDNFALKSNLSNDNLDELFASLR